MSCNTYTAENGFVITDDIVDKWAKEAETIFLVLLLQSFLEELGKMKLSH